MSAMGEIAPWLVWLLAAYLIGSVPFGLLIGLARGVDIRKAGSGNVGATNAGRVLGRKWGLLCFALDVLKGLGPVLAYGVVHELTVGGAGDAAAALQWLAVAAAAVIGHIFPVWLKFRGGKGAATGLGVVLGVWPVLTVPGIVAAALWVVLLKKYGYVSLASIVAAAAMPVLTLVAGVLAERSPDVVAVYVAVTAVLALLVALRHRSNIVRLRAGTEPRVGTRA